jgi:hypothetical protein
MIFLVFFHIYSPNLSHHPYLLNNHYFRLLIHVYLLLLKAKASSLYLFRLQIYSFLYFLFRYHNDLARLYEFPINLLLCIIVTKIHYGFLLFLFFHLCILSNVEYLGRMYGLGLKNGFF